VKFLERIAGSRKRLYQFTAIDDCTRIRVLKIYDVCNQKSAISFVDEVIRRLPFRVLVIQTDNGAEFQSNFHWHLEEQDIRHVYIRPKTPRLNGKVERSHRVDEQEFYQLLDKRRHRRRHPFVQRQASGMGGLLQLPPAPRSPRRADAIRAAPGQKNLCRGVTEVLRPYTLEVVGGTGIEPVTPAV
jgi:transposase InsO family protein